MKKSPIPLSAIAPFAVLLILVIVALQRRSEEVATIPPLEAISSRATSQPGPIKKAGRVDVQAIAEFKDWALDFGGNSDLKRGRELAENRRAAMKELIITDPERALAEALPWSMRESLPDELQSIIEEPIAATGDLDVIITCGLESGQRSTTERLATLRGTDRELRVHSFGQRLDVTAKQGIALHGIAVDNVMALANDPVREISPDEKATRGLNTAAVEVGGRLYAVDSPETLVTLRQGLRKDESTLGPRHIANYRDLRAGDFEGVEPLEAALTLDNDGGESGGESPVAESAHTEGAKTMLYIRARFADQDPGFDPLALSTLQSRQGDVEQFWEDFSYGKSTLTTTYTDTVTLTINAPTSSANRPSLGTLANDARAAAIAANPAWNYANFDFYTVLTSGGSGWGYAGVASVGGTRSHLNGGGAASARTSLHEFGHNLGLLHAQYWRTDSPSPIGRDSVPGGYRDDGSNAEHVAYGHRNSTMGAQSGSGDLNAGRGHFTTGEKVKLDWLVQGDNDWESITTSGSHRLYRFDLRATDFPAMTSAVTRAIKINLDSNDYVSASNRRRYWLSYRLLPTNGVCENWLPHGVQFDWQRNSYGGDGSIQLDMTPYTRNSTTVGGSWTTDNSDKEDGVLLVGRTYSDTFGDIHVTPTATGGSAPNEWIDVTVNIGTQATNTPPAITSFTASATQVGTGVNVTFNVAASDPNGDTLAYGWDYDDASRVVSALNNPTATKSWGTAGQYVVRATVSDMKGGVDTKDIVITVGNPSNQHFITGRILHGGIPVEGARVHIDNNNQTWTESDGTYTLPGLGLGSYTVQAAKLDLTFTPQFVNPVGLTTLDAFGKDFYANESLPGSGGLTLAVVPFENDAPIGANVDFAAEGWDGAGNSVTTNPTWSTSGGGTIDSSGIFSATTAGGPYTITANDGGTIATATVNVINISAVGITATDASASEAGPDSGTMRVERFGGTSTAIDVLLSLSGSATSGSDYTAPSLTVPLAIGQAFADIGITPIDDFTVESSEDVIVSIVDDSAYAIFASQSSATVTIADDGDVGPTASIDYPTVSSLLIPNGVGLVLTGSATDDGLPSTLRASWSMVSGPEGGSVAFDPPLSFTTVAHFSLPGAYLLRFKTSDGANSGTAEVAVIVGVSPNTNPDSTNEIAYYDFNDLLSGTTEADLAGGDHPGTLANGATRTSPGITGNELFLDGANDQLNIADSADINSATHAFRTIAFWFKADQPARAVRQVLYEEGGTSRGLNIYLDSSTVYFGGWNNNENGWNETFLSTPLSDNGWHHVAIVLDAPGGDNLQSSALIAYFDGAQIASGDGAPLNSHTGDIAIGAMRNASRFHNGNGSGTNYRFDGCVDEFHLYNRALSGLEIAQLYGWNADIAPDIDLASVNASASSVVIPGNVGIILDGNVTGGGSPTVAWSEVDAPSGGSANFESTTAPSTAATFSASGHYKLRLSAGNTTRTTALDVNVHAGFDAGSNPTTGNQIFYYSLDENTATTATDAINVSSNGTLTNGPSWSTTSVSGTAVRFDGIDDVIAINNEGGINTNGAHNRKTIALWFNAVDPGGSATEILFEQGGATRGLNIYLDAGNLYVGGWSADLNGWDETYLSTPVTAGEWHHVVLVLDTPNDASLVSGGLRAYLDGTLFGAGEAAEMGSHTGNVGLGGMVSATQLHTGNVSNDGLYFDGHIDEVHYFNNRVLTDDEIGGLYAFGNIGPAPDAGPGQPSVTGLDVTLGGSSTDDGRWTGTLDHAWSIASGPGTGTFSSSDGNGIDTMVALSDAGTYVLRLTSDDGEVTTFSDVSVTATDLGFYDQWATTYPGFTGPDALYLANADGGLLSNLEEYGLGGDPTNASDDSSLLPTTAVVEDGLDRYLEFTYRRRLDRVARGITYTVEHCSELAPGSWSALGITEIGTNNIDAEFEFVTVRIALPIGPGNERQFAHLLITISE